MQRDVVCEFKDICPEDCRHKVPHEKTPICDQACDYSKQTKCVEQDSE